VRKQRSGALLRETGEPGASATVFREKQAFRGRKLECHAARIEARHNIANIWLTGPVWRL